MPSDVTRIDCASYLAVQELLRQAGALAVHIEAPMDSPAYQHPGYRVLVCTGCMRAAVAANGVAVRTCGRAACMAQAGERLDTGKR